MRPGVEPHFVSNLKPLESATVACLEDQPSGAFSGVTKDGKACWIVRGALLVVVDASTGQRLAVWQFGRVIGDEHTSVTCVKEFGVGQSLKLLVGVCNATSTGLLCVFDVSLSKVIKAIEIPHPVTELELVSTYRRNDVPRWALSEHLCYFCGLVAVGTNAGKVYLVDMCTDDDEFFSDEEVPSKVHFISPRIRDTENQRFHCMSQGLHLAMNLNESMVTRNGFEYRNAEGLTMKTFPPDTVTVSCLKYIPQAGILTVGYSFGCYQLWKLSVPVLEYSSRLEPDPAPVTHIAYQEPENDPKNFCYIWVARGQKENQEEELNNVSIISMYQLAFNHKTFYSNYGVFYEELTSVCYRLDHELTSKLVQFGSNYDGGSRVLGCYTLVDPHYCPPSRLNDGDSFEESNHGPDLSLCVFVWEATDGSNSSKLRRYLGIFDINRWYHAQMPSAVRYASGSTEICAFFSICHLDAEERAGDDSLLMAHVVADSVRKFHTNSPIPPEQHFYPSSLAFDVTLVFETGLVDAHFLGSQRQVLANMECKGPSSLVQPLDIYSLCIHVGLLPRPVDIASVNPSVSLKREMLLGLALEYNMISFLKSCVTAWASGEYELQGCTLKFLLDWSWAMVSNTKHKIDSICVTLYNWSGLNLDQRSLQNLIQCNQRLVHLTSLFQTFLTQSGPITEQGETELQNKVLVTSLLSQHLSVVLWFVGAGLLPEDDDTEVTLGGMYCYPAISLMSAYKNRRAELQTIHSDIGETDMLMIDGLVEVMGVKAIWERDGGTGLYPPPSLHALLSSYLLENCDMLSKHSLVLYLLLDLVSVDSADETTNFSEKVSGFAQRFHLPQTLVKLIQAFWLLDHRDFEEALSLMLDPMVRSEFSRWQHKRVIKALLFQGDSKMALRYITSMKPALTTPEEVKLKLTVLLANGLTAEALEYQRKCQDKNNMHDLLSHLFLGCQQTQTVDCLLQLPLTNQEETILMEYLLESSEPRSQELLVMHYLQRSRFVEAIQLNEKLKHSAVTEASSKARERAAARNAIVDSYASILPHVQRRLMYEQIHMSKKNVQWRREVRRPTPLSTNITKTKAKVMSQSAFIMTIMEKLDEIETDQNRTEVMDRSMGPFICTPVTPARKSLGETPATVYPESAGDAAVGRGLSLNKSIAVFNNTDTPTKVDRRTSKYFSAACLSILQTPKVKKVTPTKQRLSSANMITPQSILKVRNLISTTSPSPRSASTTPNSQELEGSCRKLPRKLGYGSRSTPLSSLPRHLATEKVPSAPGSPKSVSFAEPSALVASPSDLPSSSQPSTPKSVSFMEKPVPSASKLQPMTTPKQSVLKSRLQGSGQPSKLSPKLSSPPGSRSLRDRSPTPESSEKSPRLSGSLDQLQRRPLHSPEKEPELRLRLEDSDNISDEEVEEMEESLISGIVSAADTSVSSTATLRDQEPQSLSPSTHSPQKYSPVKSASSPTVKISRSPVSMFTSMVERKSATEHAQTEVTSTETGSSVLEVTGAERVDVDLTAEDEMEVEQTDKEMPVLEQEVQLKPKSREIFEEYEEMNPPGKIEEEGAVAVLTEESGEMEQMETVSSGEAAEVQSVKQEDDEMETVSSWKISEIQSVKQELEEELPAPPEPVRHLQPPAPPVEQRSASPFSHLPVPSSPVKLKDSPPDSDYGVHSTSPDISVVKKSSPKLLDEINEMFGESPEQADQKLGISESSSGNEAEAKSHRPRRKFDIDSVVIKIEQEKASTSREASNKNEDFGVDGAPKESNVVEKIEEEATSHQPSTPTRLSRRIRAKVMDETESLQQEPVTPTRRSTRIRSHNVDTTTDGDLDEKPVTPTRSSRQRAAKVKDNLEVITATSPKPFSNRAKEAVQESLLQISQEIKDANETSPGEMTRIKEKSKSPSRTPTRSRKGQKAAVTPTRTSARLASMSEDAENDENMPTTPSRSARHQKKAETPTRSQKATSRRGQQKGEEVEHSSPEKDKNENNSSPLKGTSEHTEKVKKSPSRNRKSVNESVIESTTIEESKTIAKKLGDIENIEDSRRDSFGASEIPEEIDSVETTPSRRRSLSRACKQTVKEPDVPQTPTRRQSLGRNAKLEEDIEIIRTPTRRQSLRLDKQSGEENLTARTPTRRQTLGHETKALENIDELPKTPTRRQSLGRASKVKSKNVKEDEALDEQKEDVSPAMTPSRRTRTKKSEHSPGQDATVSKAARSGRGRKKKTDDSEPDDEGKSKMETSQSRRSKKVDTESEGETSDETEVDDSNARATRRKRLKKADGGEGSPASHTRSHDTHGVCASTDLYYIENNSFKFSDPMPVDASDQEPAKSYAPVKSFIFSPPISRARAAKVKEETQEPDTGILLPPGPSTAEGSQQEEKVDKKKRKTKRLYKEREEILLISPLALNAEDSGEEGRSIITRSSRTGCKKATTKKDGTKLVIQSIPGKTRTSHRFGPVVKKKKADK